MLLIHCAGHFQTPLDIPLIHKKRLILPVVIFILPVRHCAVISDLVVLPFCDDTGSGPVNDWLKSHPAEVLYGNADHFFKSETVADIHHRFFRQILSCIDKTDTVPFRIHIRHLPERLFRQRTQMAGCPQLIFRDILTEAVKISVVVKICIFNDIGGE